MEPAQNEQGRTFLPGPRPLYTTPQQFVLDLLLLVGGSVIFALGINSILMPMHFATGGIAGLALIIQKFFPALNLGWIYLLINVPLFVLAWMAVGRRFFFYSVIGMVSLAVSLTFVQVPIDLDDRLLNALLAGIILGIGAGLSLRSSGSQGGLDILSVMLLMRFSVSLGNTVLTINTLVLLMVAVFYSLDAVLYTLIVIYVSSKVMNIVVTGLSQRKAVFIISPHWEVIAREILKDIRKGVTIIEGRGGYSHKEEHILYAVIPTMEIGQMKVLIRRIDPDAFVVISNTQEVINPRIGNQPHW
ncbi:MAG: YitT family protein [Desulfobulbaceae bacterium]|nr:YitT family protein [Desulfobulbaceae bacterium]MDY0350283.1 YitT family protein [Desulfobulbaceae bacterium]